MLASAFVVSYAGARRDHDVRGSAGGRAGSSGRQRCRRSACRRVAGRDGAGRLRRPRRGDQAGGPSVDADSFRRRRGRGARVARRGRRDPARAVAATLSMAWPDGARPNATSARRRAPKRPTRSRWSSFWRSIPRPRRTSRRRRARASRRPARRGAEAAPPATRARPRPAPEPPAETPARSASATAARRRHARAAPRHRARPAPAPVVAAAVRRRRGPARPSAGVPLGRRRRISARSGPAPALMPGLALVAGWERDTASVLSWKMELVAAHHARDGSTFDGTGRFTLDLVTLHLCPLRSVVDRPRTCARARRPGGPSRGTDILVARTRSRPFASASAAPYRWPCRRTRASR